MTDHVGKNTLSLVLEHLEAGWVLLLAEYLPSFSPGFKAKIKFSSISLASRSFTAFPSLSAKNQLSS